MLLRNKQNPGRQWRVLLSSGPVPGTEGKLYFSGDQAFVNALSLNVVQRAEDSKFAFTITNAHTG